MFGGSKNTFGQPTTTQGFSSFSTPQQNTGFGQSAFAKPAGTFGANNTFGQPQNSVFGAQPTPGTSLFGASTPQQPQGFGSESQFFVLLHFITFAIFSVWSAATTTTNVYFRQHQHHRHDIAVWSPAAVSIRCSKTCRIRIRPTTTAIYVVVLFESSAAPANFAVRTNRNDKHSWRWTFRDRIVDWLWSDCSYSAECRNGRGKVPAATRNRHFNEGIDDLLRPDQAAVHHVHEGVR